jgi:PKD repeat protein
MKYPIQYWLIALVLILISVKVSAQLSVGGIPPGFDSNISRELIEKVTYKQPDYEVLRHQDDSVSVMGVPERMGVTIPANISLNNANNWTLIDNNHRIWRLNIEVSGAVGLALYFNDFYLSPGDELFVYSADRSFLIGAFTELNNRDNKLFATEVVKGESVIVEFVQKIDNADASSFNISEVLVVYTPMTFYDSNFNTTGEAEQRSRLDINGDSGECEVNVKCEEGDNWRDQINGVVRIMAKNGTTAFWCTGSIMNNTALDFTSYILTADHCALSNGVYAKSSDLAQWIFYFNLESRSCEDDTPVGSKSLTGAVKISSSSPLGNDGSDFFLIRLEDVIPNSYQPYFNGWNAQNVLSPSGVCIHHPAGDVKKISTYTTELELSQWGNTPETHFMVSWSETINGFGVTEGGSSGSPIYNSQKQVIGQLTGGESDCDNTSGRDHYGRVFHSWDKNGIADTLRLKPWLDPLNSGLRVINGSYNTRVAIAQFVADETIVPVGSLVNFTDLSSNEPDSWSWIFEGGNPSASNNRDPGSILYDRLGTYDVTLIVTNEYGEDSVVLSNYIRVVPTIYPNPTRNVMYLMLGNDEQEHVITITNSLGKRIKEFTIPAGNSTSEVSFTGYPAGLYLIGIKAQGQNEEFHKLIYSPL